MSHKPFHKSKFNIARQIFSLVALLLSFSSVLLSNVNVNAQLGLEPFGINKSDPKETGWFKYSVDPGAVIDDFVVISNLGADDTNVDLRSNDGFMTDDGAFTIISNDLENKELGKWVEIKENIISIPANKSVKVPFTIKVPKDIKPGEYAGGLSITEADKKDGSGAPLSVKTRIGNRIYLTVKGDLNVSGTIKDLSIINPNLGNFPDELRKRGFIKPDNIVFKYTAENTGDVYSTLKGDFKLKLPDGKEVNQTFTRNMAPRSGARTFYVETSVPYQVGKTTLDLNYTTTLQNEPKDSTGIKYNYSNDKGSLNFVFDMSEAQLNNFKDLVAKADVVNKPAKNTPAANVSTQPLVTGEAPTSAPAPAAPQTIIKEVPADNTMLMYGGIGIGLLLVALIALVGYKLLKDKKGNTLPKNPVK